MGWGGVQVREGAEPVEASGRKWVGCRLMWLGAGEGRW